MSVSRNLKAAVALSIIFGGVSIAARAGAVPLPASLITPPRTQAASPASTTTTTTTTTTLPTIEGARPNLACTIDQAGWDSVNPDDASVVRCKLVGNGWRWTLIDDTERATLPSEPSYGIGPFQPGKSCYIDYAVVNGVYEIKSPTTGQRMRCEKRADGKGYVWVPLEVAPPTTASPLAPLDTLPAPDELDYAQLCSDTQQLPPGFSLPAGAVQIPGSPAVFESDDRLFKEHRCRIEATLPANVDPEAINTGFGAQCDANGWLYYPDLVGRWTPDSKPHPNGQFGPGDMIIGSCQTTYGTYKYYGPRPWTLNWSVTTYGGGRADELMVELRAYTP